MQIVIITLAFMLGGCIPVGGTYRSEGHLALEDEGVFPYKHVAISPATDDSVAGYLAQALEAKGYTTYLTSAFRNVLVITPGNQVAVFVCKDAGTTDRGLDSYSRSVSCEAYDLHSEMVIYKGIGEFMGRTVAEDYLGALQAALARFPDIGGSGRVTSEVDLPLGRDYGLGRSAAAPAPGLQPNAPEPGQRSPVPPGNPAVILLDVYFARSDAPETPVVMVQPGDTLEQIIQYRVSGITGEGTVLLKERRSILHKEARLTDEVYEKRQGAGVYRTTLHITLPEDAAPGDYVLEASVILGTQVVSRRFEFSIAAPPQH